MIATAAAVLAGAPGCPGRRPSTVVSGGRLRPSRSGIRGNHPSAMESGSRLHMGEDACHSEAAGQVGMACPPTEQPLPCAVGCARQDAGAVAELELRSDAAADAVIGNPLDGATDGRVVLRLTRQRRWTARGGCQLRTGGAGGNSGWRRSGRRQRTSGRRAPAGGQPGRGEDGGEVVLQRRPPNTACACDSRPEVESWAICCSMRRISACTAGSCV